MSRDCIQEAAARRPLPVSGLPDNRCQHVIALSLYGSRSRLERVLVSELEGRPREENTLQSTNGTNMKSQRFALAFALAALLGSAAEAQQRPDRAEMFKRFDKNGDGQLDESERKQAREEMRRRLGEREEGPGRQYRRIDGEMPGEGQRNSRGRDGKDRRGADDRSSDKPGSKSDRKPGSKPDGKSDGKSNRGVKQNRGTDEDRFGRGPGRRPGAAGGDREEMMRRMREAMQRRRGGPDRQGSEAGPRRRFDPERQGPDSRMRGGELRLRGREMEKRFGSGDGKVDSAERERLLQMIERLKQRLEEDRRESGGERKAPRSRRGGKDF